MLEYKLKQLRFESDTWKRQIAFMIDEAIHLKQRLGEVVQQQADKVVLAEAERFQTFFLRTDHQIGLLRNEIADFDKLLLKEVFTGGVISRELQRGIDNIRANLRNLEEQFSKLKRDFNGYVLEIS